jgi:hypothetical protein
MIAATRGLPHDETQFATFGIPNVPDTGKPGTYEAFKEQVGLRLEATREPRTIDTAKNNTGHTRAGAAASRVGTCAAKYCPTSRVDSRVGGRSGGQDSQKRKPGRVGGAGPDIIVIDKLEKPSDN